jgi:hypothetical protein
MDRQRYMQLNGGVSLAETQSIHLLPQRKNNRDYEHKTKMMTLILFLHLQEFLSFILMTHIDYVIVNHRFVFC